MGAVGYNGQTGSKFPVFHSLLTNTATMLAGVKMQYNRVGRDVLAMAIAGDGGTSDAGFQSVSGAAERNDPILFICVDNEGYMNTGMQSSGVTPYGSWTSTTPVGGADAGQAHRGEEPADHHDDAQLFLRRHRLDRVPGGLLRQAGEGDRSRKDRHGLSACPRALSDRLALPLRDDNRGVPDAGSHELHCAMGV